METKAASRNQTATKVFEAAGYYALPRLLEATEVVRLNEMVDELLKVPSDPSCVRPHNTLVPLEWHDACVGLVLESKARVKRIAHAVGATDLKWISGYVSVKEPESDALWWHQDWWCWSHPISFRRQAPQVAVLCYLTPTDDHSGALRVLPESHRRSFALHRSLPHAHAKGMEALDQSHDAMRDHSSQVTIVAAPGDGVVLDYRLLHGTHRNTAMTRRNCIILNFAPAWSALPTEIRAHLIQHPSLPSERQATWSIAGTDLLPTFAGEPHDLTLNRDAPAVFEAV
jgi:hypothetical protein